MRGWSVSASLAIATAAGSFGQVIGAATGEWLLSFLPSQEVFAVALLTLVLTLSFRRADV